MENTKQPDEILNDYLAIMSELREQLKTMRNTNDYLIQENQKLDFKNQELIRKNQELSHDAALYQEYVCSELLLGLREVAKKIGIDEKDFMKWLEKKRYIQRPKDGQTNVKPMKIATENGWLKIMPYKSGNSGFTGYTVMATVKGIVFFTESLREEGLI